MLKKHRIIIISLLLLLTACSASPSQGKYFVLVNKLNQLPEDWESKLETVKSVNSVGDEVQTEKKAYEAYLKLKEALAKEGIQVDLDSAYRSVEVQQQIWDDFTEKYGADYTAKTVAVPGYSEHHTGLALDLYLIVDGRDIYENEDMIQYPEIWAKIHAKLADHGFILRYLEGKEHITGYGYEPWHIRYLDDVKAAREIMEKGITLEGYLGHTQETVPAIDLGASAVYSREELEAAVIRIKCQFAAWKGCELKAIRYAGDGMLTDENLKWLNEQGEDRAYKEIALFRMDFHTNQQAGGSWEPNDDYTEYQWWLGKNAEGGWDVVSTGY